MLEQVGSLEEVFLAEGALLTLACVLGYMKIHSRLLGVSFSADCTLKGLDVHMDGLVRL